MVRDGDGGNKNTHFGNAIIIKAQKRWIRIQTIKKRRRFKEHLLKSVIEEKVTNLFSRMSYDD